MLVVLLTVLANLNEAVELLLMVATGGSMGVE